MSPFRSRSLATRAAIYADAVSEEAAAAHQNIVDDVIELMISGLVNWQAVPRASVDVEPDLEALFVSIADALSDTFEGISSAHLQALFAAQELLQ